MLLTVMLEMMEFLIITRLGHCHGSGLLLEKEEENEEKERAYTIYNWKLKSSRM